MVKYTYKTVAYVLPDSIKKINNDVRLQRARSEKEDIKKKIDIKEQEIENASGSEKRKLERERDELKNKLISINNNIFDIKADLYNSAVNFNNSNIKKLSANINDISSFINGNKNFTEDIKDNISKILASQVNIKSIFDGVNLKDMLQEIINNTDEATKAENIEKYNEIKAIINSINENPEANQENLEKFNKIKDDLEKLIPTDKLLKLTKEIENKIEDINQVKSTLTEMIFGKGVKELSTEKITEYIKTYNSLNDLYKLVKDYLLNIPLYYASGKKGSYQYKIMDNQSIYNFYSPLKIKDFQWLINNLRKWFSNNNTTFKDIPEDGIVINDMKDQGLINLRDVKDIKYDDVKKADGYVNLIKTYIDKKHMKSYYKSKGFFKDKSQADNSENVLEENETDQNVDQDDSENKGQGLTKQCLSKGLDLDEIHNMNIMNNIIKSLDNIICNQNRIIELMIKQTPQSMQSFSERRKLGRFKVEKYNPNMSITEFKKLFDKK